MKLIEKHYRIVLLLIPLISFALHYHIFKLDLIGIHVWRQTETQTVINNFYSGDFNICNPRINDHAETSRLHRMEFPMLQWIIALFYKLLGPNIVITRLTIFITGLFSVWGIFYLANTLFGNKGISAICAWCFNWSPVFYYYTVNPLPDNLALCCGIWSVCFCCTYLKNKQTRYIVFSALMLCLATLAKLPFIIYGSFIACFLLVSLMKKNVPLGILGRIIAIYFVCILPAVAWYITVMPGWQIGAVRGVFDQKWNHPYLLGVITGTVVSVLPELLLNYGAVAFFVAGIYFLFKNKSWKNAWFPMLACWGAMVILYFLFEMNIIDLVHDYYMFPFLPPIFILVAYGAAHMLTGNKTVVILSMICLAALPATAYLRADSRWDTNDPGFNPAYYKYKYELRQITPPGAICVAGNDNSHYILLYYIDRKGWAFENNELSNNLLSIFIDMGATYLLIDNQQDTIPEIKNHLEKKLFDKETLRVYKLK